MMRTAPVHVWLPGETEPTRAGTFTHDATRRTGTFNYAESYLRARHPALAPDLPLGARPRRVIGGHGIFPLFLDAGPDAWGRNLLARRLEHEVDEMEALVKCPTDGVGNVALGDLTAERLRVLALDEFVSILEELEAGRRPSNEADDRVLDAVENGTSLGGTKPKLTVEDQGLQYLAKFPERADSPWLPQVESAMLRLAALCDVDACRARVWSPDGRRHALLVERFDREGTPAGVARKGYVSAHALLRLDVQTASRTDMAAYGPMGFSLAAVRKSYVAIAQDMSRWCAGQAYHLAERRELWRRIVFNALIRNVDDHSKNHGLLCESMAEQRWRLSPAFDLVAPLFTAEHPALALAYRYVAPPRKGPPAPPRLVTRISEEDLVAAASEHYGWAPAEAREFLDHAAAVVNGNWRRLMGEEGMPAAEIERYERTFAFASSHQVAS